MSAVMPIRPENVSRYPKEWKQIRAAILERAEHRCEDCRVPNYAVGFRDSAGAFHPLGGSGPCDAAGDGRVWPSLEPITYREALEFAETSNTEADGRDGDGNRWIVIVLTIAHLDHRPEDCSPENLKALCQRCHLRYDSVHHGETAYRTRRSGKASSDLFE
jgi:hypothetical protein